MARVWRVSGEKMKTTVLEHQFKKKKERNGIKKNESLRPALGIAVWCHKTVIY